jgi:hypothetical protein
MLAKQYEHANGICKSFRQNQRGILYGGNKQLSKIVHTKAGLAWRIPIAKKRMNAKIRRCYPRGSVWERMVKLHSFDFLAGKAKC